VSKPGMKILGLISDALALPARGCRLGSQLLLLFVLLLGAASYAQGGEFCSGVPFYGVVDGSGGYPIPTQITIDTDCTFVNFPASDPLTATLNFQTNDPSIYLIVFDNVTFTGNMACANIDHKIWFANGADYGSGNACQDLFIPVETIDKQAPATTAAIGVPFTYTLTLPSFQFSGDPSNNDLHTVTLWDELTRAATGADLTFVSIKAYYKGSGAPVTLVEEDLPRTPVGVPYDPLLYSKGGVWSPKNLSYKPIPLISAGEQVVVEITVVLDDTLANAAGTQFTNTAKWWFGRAIDVDDDGVITYPDEFFEPLPGEWGISQPMTIAEPDLVVKKTSPVSNLNVGTAAPFTIDVQNIGGSTAWNATITDKIPAAPNEGGTGGMCGYDPTTAPGGVTAQIVAADYTPVLSLNPGSDYTVAYDSAACELTVTLQDSPAARIEPYQRLIVNYDAQLDVGTAPGLTFTNVAGATSWFNGDSSNATRLEYVKTLTDGTPGNDDSQPDFQAAYTITSATQGYFFLKSVDDLTTGTPSTTIAFPGDRLRYTLQIQNFTLPTLDNITIIDDLGALNAAGAIVPGSLSLVSSDLPAGTTLAVDSTGGTSGAGAITISNLQLQDGDHYQIQFDVTLDSNLSSGINVSNQALVSGSYPGGTYTNAPSDDPYEGGPALLIDPSDPSYVTPDVTDVTIQTPGPLAKANSQSTATIGDQFTYQIRVPAAPVDVPLFDVQILDDLGLTGADLLLVNATAHLASGTSSKTLTNVGSSTSDLILIEATTGIDIPAGDQAIIEITVQLLNSTTNQRVLLPFKNRASYRYNRLNGGGSSTLLDGAEGITPTAMNVVEPALTADKTVSFVSPAGKQPSDPATVGDVLEYAVTITNGGDSIAFDTNVADTLPTNVSLVSGAATARINGVDVPGFVADPTLLPSGALAWGRQNGDETLDVPVGQSLVLTYQVTVESVTGSDISNTVYVDWSSLDGASAAERTGAGCPSFTSPDDYCYGPAAVSIGMVDNTSIAKSVVDDSYAEMPASTTDPVLRVGDTVTYELTLSLQEYTTRNVVVEDALPAGLALESFAINGGASFSYTLAAQPGPGDTGTLRWAFGDITNTPSGNGTPIDTLTIRYVARVVTDAPPTGVDFDPSIPRSNLVRLSYAGGDPDAYPGRLTATETIDVRQPKMSAISKVDLGSGRAGTGTAADPYQVSISSDLMNFRLSSCNDGLAPAYGVVITDLLAPQLEEGDLAANPPVVKIGTTTLSAGPDYTFNSPVRGGEMRFALQDSAPVNPGECVTVDYNIGFHTDITTSTTWSNEARVAEYRSLPLAEPGRLYAPSSPAQVWMTNLVSGDQLLKTLISPAEATIGNEVVYQIKVPAVPMNAALDSVAVTDSLNPALEYVGASAVDSGGAAIVLTDNSVAPGQVDLGITHIPAGGQVIITLTARMVNNDQANAGVSFANAASYTYAGASAATSSTSAALTIVEPTVTIAKNVVNVSNPGAAPKAGDILRYGVSITAGGGAVGDNYSDAFDLSIVDSLSLEQAYRSGTATVDGAGNTITDPVVTGDGSTAAQTLTWSLADATADIDVAEGTVVTLTYEVVVLNGVSPGQELTNSVTARWTGLDGDSVFERTGSGTPAENDYVAGPATTSLRTELAISFVKSVVNATTGGDPGANAVPGDTLHYALVITNESVAALNNATVLDELAAQFAPGSLQNVSVSGGSGDTSNTNAASGGNGTGIIDIRSLTLAPGDTVTIDFEATLAATIPNGTSVLNQAQLSADNLSPRTSNQTSTLISSSPAFSVLKSSQDMTGDPSMLMAGDVLRYTITVKNVGNENATGVTLRDLIPANTNYVADSTRLNGLPVADSPAGTSPLESGLAVNAPEDTTAGSMRADTNPATTSNVATITFDVRINANAVDGTVISNQGFVNGLGAGGPFPEQPSNTTQDVVGNLPLIDVQKTVEIQTDGLTQGVPDPGDVLLYTIRIDNFGAAPLSGVRVTDTIPAETIYVTNSVKLNGQTVTNNGTLPLLDILVNSPDQAPGSGIVSAGSSATVTFTAQVDNVAPGTLISNQGDVASNELPTEPTDADGDPSNGNQPTLIYVGPAQELAISKEYQIVGGGPAIPGAIVEYMVQVTNIGTVPALGVVITDSLAPPLGDQVTFVPGSALLNGSSANVSFDGTAVTATQGTLATGSTSVLRFRAQIAANQVLGTNITNTAQVIWNTAPQSESASATLTVGGDPVQARLNGTVWHDANFSDTLDSGESLLSGWTVEIYRNGQRIGSTVTDANGAYTLSGLTPNEGTANSYGVRFLAPGAGADSALLGMATSPFTNGLQSIDGIIAGSGDTLQNLNLPIDPNGVVFNSVTRAPVAGATVTLLHNDTPVDRSCFDDPAQQNQVTLASGYYKFNLVFSDSNPSCPPAGSTYEIRVTAPATGYAATPSQIIPSNGEPVDPFSVPACPGSADDAVPATAEYCEASAFSFAPPLSVAARTDGTVYHLHLTLSNAVVPGGYQIFNNNIPIDPELDGAVAITKTSPRVNVSKGELVPYTITVRNVFGSPLFDLEIVDRFPAGFKYVKGSARLDGKAREPEIDGRQLSWDGLDLQFNAEQTIQLLLVVGAGVSEGEYVNRAQVRSTATAGDVSGEAAATVRVVPDPTFDCTDVIGKVFDDRNLNGRQDPGEDGLAGVRVVTVRGLNATTDEHGRFHIDCAAVPDEDRGSNFILKLDDRSLPTGYRLTTENPRVQRATRGKMLRFNFGATLHRVVSIDLADGVFEPETTELRLQWRPKIARLLEELRKSPALLRLSYLADVEREGLVRQRLAALKREVSALWDLADGGYRLTIETEVFWRRGGPVQ